jgi:hypothetical protein
MGNVEGSKQKIPVLLNQDLISFHDLMVKYHKLQKSSKNVPLVTLSTLNYYLPTTLSIIFLLKEINYFSHVDFNGPTINLSNG